ncbi:MAG: hypothetical protein CV087_23130 [Candidatus Brocadia sp. WS118]|nr:MAG: hypothetical protein CV087_23130 [Candidatus Brocadia sp. WS118]
MKILVIILGLFLLGIVSSIVTTMLARGIYFLFFRLIILRQNVLDITYQVEMALARYILATSKGWRLKDIITAIVIILSLTISPVFGRTITSKIVDSNVRIAVEFVNQRLEQINIDRRQEQRKKKFEKTNTYSGAPPDLWREIDSINQKIELASEIRSNFWRVESKKIRSNFWEVESALLYQATEKIDDIFSQMYPEYSNELNNWIFRHFEYTGAISLTDIMSLVSRIYENISRLKNQYEKILPGYEFISNTTVSIIKELKKYEKKT